ncbi:MAG: protein phosphatase 2C domain-containing protein [Actinomycetes bacterium]
MNRSFKVIARSELGLVRDGNEDSALVSARLVAVADGMGGHAGGEVASKIAITSVKELSEVLNNAELDSESREDLLLNISFSIDHEIAEVASSDRSLQGMGTTLTALHLNGDRVELLHIGDSRCYQWNGKKLIQLSYDHTVMQELLDQGRLTADEVINHPQRSLLTQALIGDSGIDPILNLFEAKLGDHFLLCSDGLSSVLSDLEIVNVIKNSDPAEVVNQLIAAVLEKGAPDNVTILWAEIIETEVEPAIELLGAARI